MLLFCYDSVFAQQNEESAVVKKPKAEKAKEAPTKIRSDIMDIKRKSQTVNFIGHVVIEKQDSSLLSEKMTILYNETEKKDEKSAQNFDDQESQSRGNSSIKKIYTDEKVKIFSEDFVAIGDSGYYDPQADVFVLEKNVMVNNGVSIAKGDKFVHHISTKKSNFVGKKEDEDKENRVVVILGDDAKEFKKSKKQNGKDVKR